MRMFPLKDPVAEQKNKSVNLSVTEESGRMLQINCISPRWLKDTFIRNAGIQVVLIGKYTTYTSNSANLSIACFDATPGKPFRVHIETRLKTRKYKPLRIEAQMNALIPEPQYIKTDINPQKQ